MGDTIADIKEGVNAGVWTVGVILGSNEMGLTQEETEKLPSDELNKRMAAVRKTHVYGRCPLCGKQHCRTPRKLLKIYQP